MNFKVAIAGGIAATIALAGCGGTSGTNGAGSGASGGPGNPPSPNTDAPAYKRVLDASEVEVDTSDYRADGPYDIIALTQGPINGWGTLFDAQLTNAADKSSDVASLTIYPSMADPGKETQDLELAINKQPDALIVTPMSAAALAAPITRAKAAGIPVINCGARSEGDGFVTEVGQPLYPMGFQAAVKLAEMLDGTGKIVMINGIPGVDAGDIWKTGGQDALKSYPDIEVVAEGAGNWSTADSKKLMSSQIAAHSQIDGVLAMGMEMGIGVAQAFIDADKPIPPITGTGAMNGFNRIALDDDFKWWAISYNPSLSKVCLDTALKVLAGETVTKYIDGTQQMEGAMEFSDENEEDTYKPNLSDQLPLGPTFLSDAELEAAGFKK